MATLINIIFGFLAGWLVYRGMAAVGASNVVAAVVGVLMGIVVYLLNLAGAFA